MIEDWMSLIQQSAKRLAVPIMTHPGIELIGRTVKDAVTNGQIHYEAICALNDKYPAGATTVIMDLTVEAEAFGAEVRFPDDEVPSVTGRLLYNEKDIELLTVPEINTGRIPEYIKANELVAQKITDKPVFSGCIGPFSLAGRLYDMTEIMMLIFLDPESASLLLEKCTRFLIKYCRALKKTGASGIIIAEPASGLLSDTECRIFSSFYVKQIVEAVQDETFAVILHNCGNTGHCTQAMISVGAKGYHFGNKIDLRKAIAEIPEEALVFGNLDPVSIFKQSDESVVYDETIRLLESMRGYPNFVLSSGCDIPPHIPLENISAFYLALEDFNNRL